MRVAVAAPGVAALVLALPVSAAPPGTQPLVASLRTLPPPPRLPDQFRSSVVPLAAYVGITPTVALQRTRLLLRNVTGLLLYAFAGTQGRICFTLWRGGGTCGEVSASHDVVWLVNGGNRRRGEAVVGIVSDRVRAVDVTIRGRLVRASVRHNAFFVPFRSRPGARLPVPVVRAIKP
jgi:hypothetical protein